MAQKNKEFRPKARKPRGFRDRRGSEILFEQEVLEAIARVYRAYGFDPLETPAFEYTDALGKFLPDVDRPNQGVFSLQDDDEQWMSLRYDLTAPLARYVAENYDALPKPFRRYAVGSVWRNEKPGPGRFREFTQCDADTVGAPAPYADAEMCIMFVEAIDAAIDAAWASPFRAPGLKNKPYTRLHVSNRKLVDGLFERLGLSGAASAERRLGVMRSMDKFDRLGADGVALLLGPGRKDASGDFTAGVGLGDGEIEHVLAFLRSSDGANEDAPLVSLERIGAVVGETKSGADGVAELEGIARSVPDFEKRRIFFDCAIIRGLEYYTGPVFEAAFVSTEFGTSLGSIGGGGRYDGLVSRFKGVEVPAVGVSVGVSRLVSAFEFGTDALVEPKYDGPVVVLALDPENMAGYQAMAAELRAAGIRAEVYLGGANFGKQLKYADKRRAPIAVIEGGDERAKGEVTIKDLVLGAKLSQSIEDNAEWREAQPAQVSAPRSRLVEAVKEVLARKHP